MGFPVFTLTTPRYVEFIQKNKNLSDNLDARTAVLKMDDNFEERNASGEEESDMDNMNDDMDAEQVGLTPQRERDRTMGCLLH